MFRVMWFLLLAVLFYGANCQRDCVPDPVEALQLDATGILSWSASTNCDDTSYLIYMIQQDAVDHFFQVYETFLNVSFLPACEFVRFVVVAVAYTDLSEERYIDTTLPAEPDANVTVTHFALTPQSEGGVLLEWELEPKFAHCVQYFRVVHWDFETVPVDTYTTFDNILIDSLAPCTQFEFTVTPIYNDELEGGIGLTTYESPPRVVDLPTLENVRPGVSYIDMNWLLPSYSSNRCPITSIIVDGSPYANLSIPIEDSPARPPVSVHVDSLQSDRMYLFRVTLINSAGASRPMSVAIQTLLPQGPN